MEQPLSKSKNQLKNAFARIAAFACIGAAFCSCGSGGCLENGSTLPLAGLYSAETQKSISVDSLEVRGIGAPDDSLLVSPGRGTSSIYMPFRADFDKIDWVFAFRTEALDYPQLYDTLSFEYTTIPYFASADCGAMYVYHVNKVNVTHHLIDSVAVTDSLFTNVDREQIKIFYRTEQEAEY